MVLIKNKKFFLIKNKTLQKKTTAKNAAVEFGTFFS